MAIKPPKTFTWPFTLTCIGVMVLSVFLSQEPRQVSVFVSFGAGLVFLTWLCWFLAKKWDRKNAILEAAPLIPMKFLEVDDDAWVMGSANSNTPVYIPFFHHQVLHYSYRMEEYVTKTRTKSNGASETYREWETKKTEFNQTDFQISQDDLSLTIIAKDAQFCHESTETITQGNLRHSCTFLPNHCKVHAVGVVGERKDSLIAKAHIPLIITTKTRNEFLESAEQSEQNAKNIGLILFLVGTYSLCLAIFTHLELQKVIPMGDNRVGVILFNSLGACLATGTLWLVHLFNRMVIFRARVRERWSQIDVILKQRFDLLPNIASVLELSKLHETTVHELVAKARSLAVLGNQKQQISNEKNLAESVSQLLALRETYPDLKTNSSYLKASNDMVALENKIAHAREIFNFAVLEFNAQAESFPSCLFVRIMGFSKQEYFSN